MLKQVFTKLFKTSNNTNNGTNDLNKTVRHDQNPIYAIPTVSSCFQSNNMPSSLTNYYDLNDKIDTNFNDSSNFKSTSSVSASSSLSSSSSSNGLKKIASSTITKTNDFNKFSDSNTRQIYIAPHCIRYSNSTLDDTIYRIDDDSLNEIAAEILESDNLPPKLQIVYYDGNYFAINNSNLQIYKQLQISGLITHVQADLISVEAIPYALRQHLLQTPFHLGNNEEITDEEEAFHSSNLDRNGAASSSSGASLSANADTTSRDTTENLADIIIPSSVIEKNLLVDETYEFGVCENCLESENDELEGEEEDLECNDDDELDVYENDFEETNFSKQTNNNNLDVINDENNNNFSTRPKNNNRLRLKTNLKDLFRSRKSFKSNKLDVDLNLKLKLNYLENNDSSNENQSKEDPEHETFLSDEKNLEASELKQKVLNDRYCHEQKLDKKNLKEPEFENLLLKVDNEFN